MEILFRGKNSEDKWVYGQLTIIEDDYYINYLDEIVGAFADTRYIDYIGTEVSERTIGQFTGMKDKNVSQIFVGDIVRFNCQLFEVVMECGAFGLACKDAIDYDRLEKTVYKETTNWYCGCCNDNFISLYEIYSNFNCEENIIQAIDIVGNKFDGFKYEMMPKEFIVGEDGEKK